MYSSESFHVVRDQPLDVAVSHRTSSVERGSCYQAVIFELLSGFLLPANNKIFSLALKRVENIGTLRNVSSQWS